LILNGTLYHAGPPIAYETMLKLACRNGARMARLENKIGSLEAGKLADIILVQSTDYDQFPVVDPLITLSQNSCGRDVRTVIVDGRVVMQDREFKTIDLDHMRHYVGQRYTTIMQRYDLALDRDGTPH
jgi:5-methylthioadenosine/S-adenosylhomocysteine deaminase